MQKSNYMLLSEVELILMSYLHCKTMLQMNLV